MSGRSRVWRIIDTLLLFLCAALLVRLVLVSGAGQIWGYVQRLGGSTFAVLGLAAVTLSLETLSWTLCSAHPGAKYPHYLGAILPGQALNNLLPSGNVGELLKSRLIARRVGDDAIVSLVLYNFNSFTVAASLMLLGAIVAMLSAEINRNLALALLGAAVVVIVVTLVIRWLLRRGVSTVLVRVVTRLFRFKDREAWVDRANKADEHIRGYRARNPLRFVGSWLAMLAARGSQIFEVILICWAFGTPVTVAQAFVVQVASQLVIWVLSFIPGQVYVLEEGSRRVFALLGLDPLLGLAMELTRRGRKLLNIITGMTVLLFVNLWSTDSLGGDSDAT